MKMVEMVIDSVRVSLTNQQRIIVLREANAERYLPIWIGPYEAEAITVALQEIEVARPQTHDLIKNVLQALGARLVRVEVISLRDDVFYGNLVVEANGETVTVDTRPSDAMALAARLHVPIFVSQEVLEVAGIVPEEDLKEDEESPEDGGEEEEETSTTSSASEERLSVFEDFLENLDLPDDDEKDDDDSPDDSNPEDDLPLSR